MVLKQEEDKMTKQNTKIIETVNTYLKKANTGQNKLTTAVGISDANISLMKNHKCPDNGDACKQVSD